MVKREKSVYMIQSVANAMDVLEELAKSKSEIGVTELSNRLGLHKNMVFRLLATLEFRGCVEQNTETEDYRLGVKTLELGQSYLQQNSFIERATPFLKNLRDISGETVSIALLRQGKDNVQVHFPLSFESKRPVRCQARDGIWFGAKENAAGRLLLAQLEDAKLEELLSGNTPQDAAIRGQLNDLRATGRIYDKGAIEPDVMSLAQLVYGKDKSVMGAIEVTAPQYRARVENIASDVAAAADKMSKAFGYMPAGLSSRIDVEKDSSQVQELQ